ncbi:MAG: PEP-CTERM sorting domain-containing protein [Desulfomicrobium sp.]|nr:PEP-CTERM sorting domain-containing protein [Desulfomicrobium sp.]
MKSSVMLAIGVLLFLCSGAIAAPVVDVVQAPTGFFVPTDAQKYDSPYYRWNGQDWGWTHTPIASSWTTATLNISAFDVDFSQGERDMISLYSIDDSAWVNLDFLAGGDNIWSFTTFNLTNAWANEILAGLQVRIGISVPPGGSGWAVTLAKSVLSLDGGTLPDPDPGVVPEPSTALLLGTGFLGLAYLRRRS